MSPLASRFSSFKISLNFSKNSAVNNFLMPKFTLTFASIPSFSHNSLAFRAFFNANNAIAIAAFDALVNGRKSDGFNTLSPFFHLINASKLIIFPVFISTSG